MPSRRPRRRPCRRTPRSQVRAQHYIAFGCVAWILCSGAHVAHPQPTSADKPLDLESHAVLAVQVLEFVAKTLVPKYAEKEAKEAGKLPWRAHDAEKTMVGTGNWGGGEV